MDKSKPLPRRGFLAAGIALAGVIGGGSLIVASLPEPPVEPETGADFSVDSAAQQPVGPTDVLDAPVDEHRDSTTDTDGQPLVPDGDSSHSGSRNYNRLVIPALGVTAPLYKTGVRNNKIEPPLPVSAVGIWTGGGQLGQPRGSVLISGHVAWNGTKGALYKLVKLQPGNVAHLVAADGTAETFKVISVTSVHKSELPPKVFAGTDTERLLHVVTCGGRVTRSRRGGRNYSDNVIATFAPVWR